MDWHRLRPVLDRMQIHNYLVPEVRDETEVQASATNDNRWRVGVLCDEIPVAYRPETCQHKEGKKQSIITHSPDGHFKQTSNTEWCQKENLYTPLYINHYTLSKDIWESGPKSQLGMWLKKCPCTVRICKATLQYRHKDACLYSTKTQGWDNITYHSSKKKWAYVQYSTIIYTKWSLQWWTDTGLPNILMTWNMILWWDKYTSLKIAAFSILCRLPPTKSPDFATDITAHRGTQSAEYGQPR